MPILAQSGFPTIETVMNLARSIVNDTFPGLTATPGEGRILTDDAPFTLPYLNSAFRTLQRKLRLEGVTFPIKDNIILENLTPVVTVDPSVQVFVGFSGYFDGTAMHASPKLPSDCMQVFVVQEQTAGTGNPFVPMNQPQEGLVSAWQGPWLGMWEWRQYQINMVGSTQTKNLRIRYQSGQPPLDVPAADFSSTAINILDCEDALAYMIAAQYASARGAADVPTLEAKADDIIGDMAAEWVRRQQTVNYSRPSYGGGGSGDAGGSGGLGQTGAGA
jgi:hypothetical protein